MLPEISQDTSLRQSLPRSMETEGETAIKRSNFVSILAELDIEAMAWRSAEGKAEAAKTPEKQAQDILESGNEGLDAWSIGEADLAEGIGPTDDAGASWFDVPELLGDPQKEPGPVSDAVHEPGRARDQRSRDEAFGPGKEVALGDMSALVAGPQERTRFRGRELGLSGVAPMDLVKARGAAKGGAVGVTTVKTSASRVLSRADATPALSQPTATPKPVLSGELHRAHMPPDQSGRSLPVDGMAAPRFEKSSYFGEPSATSVAEGKVQARFAFSHSDKEGIVADVRAAATRDGTDMQRSAAPTGDTLTMRASGAPGDVKTITGQGTPLTAMKALPDGHMSLGEEGSSMGLEEILSLSDRAASVGREAVFSSRIPGPGFNADQPQALTVIRQVSDAIRLSPGGGIDIALSPEELGSVRLKLTGNEGQMTVIVQADRQETLDLMRRHIDSLSNEFRSIGYGDVSFSFQSGSSPPQGRSDDNEAITLVIEETEPDSAMERETGLGLSAGLDIRI